MLLHEVAEKKNGEEFKASFGTRRFQVYLVIIIVVIPEHDMGQIYPDMDIPGKSISREKIKDKAIGRQQLEDCIRDGAPIDECVKAVGRGNIESRAVGKDQLDLKVVGKDHLEIGAVTTDRIRASAVGADQLKPRAVRTAHIADGAVHPRHVASRGIGPEHIADRAVGKRQVESGLFVTMRTTTRQNFVTFGNCLIDLPQFRAGQKRNANGTLNGVKTGDSVIAMPKIELPKGLLPVRTRADSSKANRIRVTVYNSTNTTIAESRALWSVVAFGRA